MFSFEIILKYSYISLVYLRIILKYFSSFILFSNFSGVFGNGSFPLRIILGRVFANDLLYYRWCLKYFSSFILSQSCFWSISIALICFEITLEHSSMIHFVLELHLTKYSWMIYFISEFYLKYLCSFVLFLDYSRFFNSFVLSQIFFLKYFNSIVFSQIYYPINFSFLEVFLKYFNSFS